MLTENTPIETHLLHGIPVIVKREDLSCPFPGPSFSKIRGVVAHMASRPEKTIGVLDTFHSKAGWAVSFSGMHLNKEVVNYWPRYKADWSSQLPREQQQLAESYGAVMVDLKAGRSAVLYHAAKKHLRENFPDSYMMPNALKLPESITENAEEVKRTASLLPTSGIIVISISSGTVASGVLKGLNDAGLLGYYEVILHMGYTRSHDSVIQYMEKVSGLQLLDKVTLIDEGYGYADSVPPSFIQPFPLNPYYDAKAWLWLSNNIQHLGTESPIVFWSIGA